MLEVNKEEYINLLNQALREHPEYEEGMKIVGAPEGYSASDFTGFHCVGPKYKTESILVEIQAKVQKNYIVAV